MTYQIVTWMIWFFNAKKCNYLWKIKNQLKPLNTCNRKKKLGMIIKEKIYFILFEM